MPLARARGKARRRSRSHGGRGRRFFGGDLSLVGAESMKWTAIEVDQAIPSRLVDRPMTPLIEGRAVRPKTSRSESTPARVLSSVTLVV